MPSTFEENVFVVDSPSQIPLDAFYKAMDQYKFACIRGIVSPEEVKKGMEMLKSRFSSSDDHPGMGQSPDAVRTNFQKLNIGGESLSRANDDARFFRAFYNPIWEEDIYGLRDVFIRVAKVRNVIAQLPEKFATTEIESNGLWTASRIHQYPAGGGFFRKHTDYVVSDIADKASTKFYQLILTITQKGEHFHKGGGFVESDGERIMLEDHFGPGDIVVYDGRSVHGVEDIDADLPLEMDKINGRLAGFVTLFKVVK